MRILIALVVVVAAVVALLLLLPSREAPNLVEPAAVGSAEPPSGTLELHPTESRVVRRDPSSTAETEGDVQRSFLEGCQLEIELVGEEKGFWGPAKLQCFDTSGVPVFAVSRNATIWDVPEAQPGELHVEVRPEGPWLPAGARIDIAPAEKTKRVEIALRPARNLRVRWQATDGRPIVTALRDPGVLEAPAMLWLVLGSERRDAGAVAPTTLASHVRLVTHEVNPSNETTRGPPWDDAPPDAVDSLTLTIEPPCAVHACIGGLVVESAEVLPDTKEILFRTDLDDVRKLHTTVRFCVVASERDEALAGVEFSANSESGGRLQQTILGSDGCHEVKGLTPGEWTLQFRLRGRAHHAQDIVLAPGAVVDLGRIALAPVCPLSVRVLAPNGNPAPRVVARLMPLDSTRPSWSMSSGSRRDEVLTFPMVPDERVVLVVNDDSGWAAAPLLVEPCGSGLSREELTLQLAESTPVVLDFGRASPLFPSILVADTNGLPVGYHQIGLTGLARMRLLPGEYTVARHGIPGAHAFTVGRESTVIEIR